MSKPKVLITRRINQTALAPIQATCDIQQWDSDDAIPRATLLEWIAGMDGLYCLITDRIDAAVLDAAGPGLRVVSTMSVGYDHVDVAACKARNVLVGNTPGVLTDTTADLTLALLLATARRLPESIEAVKSGEWSTWKPEWMTGRDLYGSTVGMFTWTFLHEQKGARPTLYGRGRWVDNRTKGDRDVLGALSGRRHRIAGHVLRSGHSTSERR